MLYFEGQGDQRTRIIRAAKNRFGAVNEIAVFVMDALGLQAVTNPSAIFLARQAPIAPGTVVAATWEGSRPILVEIQALVDKAAGTQPRRTAVGVDANRLALLLAILCSLTLLIFLTSLSLMSSLLNASSVRGVTILSLKDEELHEDWCCVISRIRIA